MRANRWHSVLALLIVLGGAGSVRAEGWWSDLFRRPTLSLTKVLETPESFRGQTLAIPVQLQGPSKLDDPYFTRFDHLTYLSFSVWSDEAPLWERDVFRADFPFVFLARSAPEAPALLGAPAYSRWVLTVKVAEVLKGKPWLEVLGVKRIEDHLTEPTLISIVKALQLRDLRRFDAAASEFRNADQKGIPAPIRAMVMREEALALHASGKSALAVTRLIEAIAVKDEPTTRSVLAMCRDALGLDADGVPRNGGRAPARPLPERPAAER